MASIRVLVECPDDNERHRRARAIVEAMMWGVATKLGLDSYVQDASPVQSGEMYFNAYEFVSKEERSRVRSDA